MGKSAVCVKVFAFRTSTLPPAAELGSKRDFPSGVETMLKRNSVAAVIWFIAPVAGSTVHTVASLSILASTINDRSPVRVKAPMFSTQLVLSPLKIALA
jgi:hypothetical protein